MESTSAPPKTSNDAIDSGDTSPATIASTSASSSQNKRNAFTALMSPHPKKPTPTTSNSKNPPKPPRSKPFLLGKDALNAYTTTPTSYPPSRVLYFTPEFVAINDLYPKSSIHTLLLWRSPKNILHPFDAFTDLDFLARVKIEVAKLRGLVANELRRRYGRDSVADRRREAVLNGEVAVGVPAKGERGEGKKEGEDEEEENELPPGRDWSLSVMSGIHARPSMNHFHVHVLSEDRHSDSLKHRKHYNSFSTPFFIPIEDFPLANDDLRRHPGREGYLEREFVCWRCGRGFGKSFKRLKEHLEVEFEEWRRE